MLSHIISEVLLYCCLAAWATGDSYRSREFTQLTASL
jgi:hypothetical protein